MTCTAYLYDLANAFIGSVEAPDDAGVISLHDGRGNPPRTFHVVCGARPCGSTLPNVSEKRFYETRRTHVTVDRLQMVGHEP